MRFIDEVEIVVASGDGGDGCVSFRRERFVPRGGPDGGDGGDGGSLILEATLRRNTLQDYRHNRLYRAKNGTPGRGSNRTGARGADLVLQVPVGTIVHDDEAGEVLADLDVDGARWVLTGGHGGRGNIHFKSSTHRTPRIAEEGTPGTELAVRLELKLIADVGLLGFPNAGKSTLISRISAARPRVAAHPFTTLVPNLGVVELEPGSSFVVADIPGLIEGAADGRGLGHDFLRHVQRCSVYLHLVSTEAWEDEPVDRFRKLMDELEAFDDTLLARPHIVLLTKIDLVDDDTRADLVRQLEAASGGEVIAVSSVSGAGVPEVVGRTWDTLRAQREDAG